MFSGNLPSRMRVHCREQVCGARDTPNWFSWNRHRSCCHRIGLRLTRSKDFEPVAPPVRISISPACDELGFGDTVEPKQSNGNTTKILQTWSGSPYTFCTSGVRAVWQDTHRRSAKVVAQHGYIRKTSRKLCKDWFPVRNTEFCTSRPNRRHQE